MGRGRRHIPPFETEIHRLGERGAGIGTAPDGRTVLVRGAPPGGRVAVTVFKRKKGELHARRHALIRPPADGATPKCAVFGLCGGCVLQELDLDAQRRAKQELVAHGVGDLDGIRVHPIRGPEEAYGYRNKVELSFGVRRYLSEEEHAEGLPIDGRFLGFHAPGRFDRVVDATRCELISDAANAVIGVVREHALRPDAPPPYDVRSHEGFWRHLVLRTSHTDGTVMVLLVTASGDAAPVHALAEALMNSEIDVAGVVHAVRDEVSDVARGEIAHTWGEPNLRETLGPITFEIDPYAFFQTNTEGARVLYETVGEAVGRGGTLLDLYCGTGTIGLYLAEHHDAILGVEVVEASIVNARANAAAHGITKATYITAKVEDALPQIEATPGPRRIVVDPPRAGLHPKVCRSLAAADADVLVYVACRPLSLGRDRAVLESGGWRLTDLWSVDLFPQTGHVEAIARFDKGAP